MDDIWENAKLEATNAQSRIDAIPVIGAFSDNGRRAGANANFMFNVPFHNYKGLSLSGKRTMGTVKSVQRLLMPLLFEHLTNFI